MWRRGVSKVIRVGIGFSFSLVLLYIAALLSLRISGFEYAAVVSNSMQPHAARGDLVILQPGYQPQLGDVVTFQRGKTTVLHRLIEFREDGDWKTKGDNNSIADPWTIQTKQIQAVAVGRLAIFGWPLIWFHSSATSLQATWAAESNARAAVTSKNMVPLSVSWQEFSPDSFGRTFLAQDIRIDSTGERRLYSKKLCPGECRLYFEAKLTSEDPDYPGFKLLFNACADTADAIFCGWQIRFVEERIELRMMIANQLASEPLAQCELPANHNFLDTNIYSVSRASSKFLITVNGHPCVLGDNLASLAELISQPMPTGSYVGFWISGTTTFRSPKTNVLL